MKILVTAVGGSIGQGIIKSIKLSNLECEIVTADAKPDSAGLYRGSSGYVIPLANKDNFIDEIIRICIKEDIDGILIGTEYETLKFAENKGRIEKETNAKVIVSSPEKIKIANDKWLTYEFLAKNKLSHIPSVLPDDIDQLDNYPLIIKPRIGDSSKDIFVVQNRSQLNEKIKYFEDNNTSNVYVSNTQPMIQEYIPAEDMEFTSTTLTFNGQFYGIISMNREMRFKGITTKAIIDDFPEINKKVKKVAEIFNAFGPANFQSRFYDDEARIFEINCRFSGTTAVCANVGFNSVEAVLRHVILDEPIHELKYRKGMVVRYFNELFVKEREYLKLKKNRFINNPKSEANKVF